MALHADIAGGRAGEALKAGVSMLRKGFSRALILSELSGFFPAAGQEDVEEMYSICRARIRGREKFSESERMLMNLEDVRFATPEKVAAYRAGRIASEAAADLACGIGGQAVFLAKSCGGVLAIERDSRKIAYARRNAAVYGVGNIRFIEGDCLDPAIVRRVRENCERFLCDPQRPLSDKLGNLAPRLEELRAAYGDELAYEYPPQTSPQAILFDCEKEYLSVGGKLSRLTLYFGSLKRHGVSAVSLPGREVLHSGMKAAWFSSSARPLAYLYEVDTAVSKAGLLPQLAARLHSVQQYAPPALSPERRALLTSEKKVSSPFLRRFRVMARCRNAKGPVRRALAENNMGTVVLRSSVAPRDYWAVRKGFESPKLPGKAHLFVFKSEALVCREDG